MFAMRPTHCVVFPHAATIRRLMAALPLEQNDKYATQKCYVTLDSFAARGNPPIRLPATPVGDDSIRGGNPSGKTDL